MGSEFKLSESARRLGLSFNSSPGGGLANALRGRRLYAVIVAVLALIGVSLPPISLPARVAGGVGCTSLNDAAPAINHPDGLSVTVLPGSKLNVKLESIPRLNFLEGSVGGELKKAVQALPANLTVKSPLYQVNACGSRQGQAVLTAYIPNEAEPWQTLDLYAWSGQQWQWLGSQLDLANETISAQVSELPAYVAVVQTAAVEPAVASDATTQTDQLSGALPAVNEIVLPGLMIGNLGQVQGSPANLSLPEQGSSYALIPAVRNWAEESPQKPNVGLVLDMLSDDKLRTDHIQNLSALVAETPYAGLQIDYRGLPADSRQAFSTFIVDLATALHQKDKLLSVVLPPPSPTIEGTWDSAGYDWRAVGATADGVVLQPTTDLTAYGQNGPAEQILRWATAQVSRYKLQLAFSALSEEVSQDQANGQAQVKRVPYEEALKPLGVITSTGATQVGQGQAVTLKLSGQVQSISYDSNAKLYRLTDTQADQNNIYYLVTAETLNDRLNLAARYNLRGVTVYGLLGAGGSDSRLLTTLQQYREKSAPSAPGSLQVVWTVRDQAGAQLSGGSSALTNTQYVWTAPSTPGRYVVAAAIPGAASRGEMPIEVLAATPTPQPTPTGTPGPTPTPTTAANAATAAGCLNAAYVADVTVPDGKQYDKNASFTKTWKVRNSGSCDWDTGVVIAFQSGDKMEAPNTVAVGKVKAGQDLEISIPMKSPNQDGNFKSVWRLQDSQGSAFGELLTVLIVAGVPPTPQAPVANVPANAPAGNAPAAAPRPVAIGGFEIGGHIAGFSRPDLMKQAGMNWVKVQVHHGDVPGDLIATAHNNGFKILFGALGDKGQVMSDGYLNEYAQWVGDLAAAGADAIEVWNEPNIDHEWPVGQINGGNYTRVLAKAYPAIKARNAGTLVISAALAPTGFFATGCADNGCNDDVFLSQMAAAGAANYADCIGAHHNAGATSPSATSGHPADGGGRHYSWYFWPTLNLYYNAFGGARKVCFTEFGYVTDEGFAPLESAAPAFAWAKDVTLGQQASWLAEAASLSGNSGKVRLLIIWNIDFTYYGSDPQAGYAIIRPDGSCPACGALGQVMGSR